MGLIAPSAPPWFPMSFSLAWTLSTNAVTLLIALLIVIDTRLRFDRIAGRMTEGKIAIALDGFIHAQGMGPVLLNGQPNRRIKPTEVPVEAAGLDV
jgi:hypothetical protein